MPWDRKMYRGGKIWAEVDSSGELVQSHGVVKIRYREEDEREYSAKASEVEEIDEQRLEAVKEAKRKAAPQGARPKAGSDSDLPADAILAYTDGSCFSNPGPAGLGVLLEWKGQTREISHYLGHGTNNIAELEAIHHALKAIKRRHLAVRLYTDSAYAIGVLTQGWKANENRELIASIRREMQGFENLELRKVKGHAGDPRNERVDQLARDAIDNGAP